VNLVVDDKPPCLFTKQAEVRKITALVRPPRDYLVSGDSYRRDRFGVSRILSDLFPHQIGLIKQLLYPLVNRRYVSC